MMMIISLIIIGILLLLLLVIIQIIILVIITSTLSLCQVQSVLIKLGAPSLKLGVSIRRVRLI